MINTIIYLFIIIRLLTTTWFFAVAYVPLHSPNFVVDHTGSVLIKTTNATLHTENKEAVVKTHYRNEKYLSSHAVPLKIYDQRYVLQNITDMYWSMTAQRLCLLDNSTTKNWL